MFKSQTTIYKTTEGSRSIISIVLFALLIVIPNEAKGQTKGTASEASAKAVVIWSVNVKGIQNLRFDEINMGEEKVINPDGSVSGLNISGQEQAGKFRIRTPQSFYIEFKDLPSAMEGPQGNSLPVEFFAAWSHNQFPDIQDLNIFDVNSALSIPSTDSLRDIYLFLGARVTPAQTQLLGDYNVRVTLSITHGI